MLSLHCERLLVLVVTVLSITANSGNASEPPQNGEASGNLSADATRLSNELASRSAVERGKAAQQLGELGIAAESAIPRLIGLLSDQEPIGYESQSIMVHDSLMRMRHVTVERGVSVADKASIALNRIGSAALTECIAALDKSRGGLRLQLIHTLGKFDDKRAARAITSLLNSPDSKVRETVVRSLRECREPLIVMPLIRAMRDSDAMTRWQAVAHFERHCDSRTIEPLLEALRDSDEYVRNAAIGALGQQRDVRALSRLLSILQNKKEHFSVRFAAAYSLGMIGTSTAVEAVAAVLKDRSEQEDVRCGAARGLGMSKNRHSSEPLIAVIKDTQDVVHVRKAAVIGLADLEGKDAIPLFSQLAKATSDENQVRFWAAMMVTELLDGAIDEDALVSPLLRGFYDATECHEAFGDRLAYLQMALARIQINGKTEAVRSAARRRLQEGR